MLLAVRWAWTFIREGPSRNFAVASKGDKSAPVRVRWNVFIHHFEREPDCSALQRTISNASEGMILASVVRSNALPDCEMLICYT